MSEYESPGTARQRRSDERLDGITKMTGHVTFNTGGVSLDVDVPADGGSIANCSDYEAAGATGSSIGAFVVFSPAAMNAATKKLTSTLAAGTQGSPYTVKVKYKLNGAAATALTGSIASAPASGQQAITLQ
jgi:hypothetical protein